MWTSLADTAWRAGCEAIALRSAGLVVERKSDGSPASNADLAAERMLLAALARLDPKTPVISEEMFERGEAPGRVGRRFYLVDPLDGTRGFIAGGDEFTVNIGLVEDGVPVGGVVAAPALGRTMIGWGATALARQGAAGAWESIRARTAAPLTAVAALSRGADAATEARARSVYGARSLVRMNSSWKFCLIACGEADVYPRRGRTMVWDTAAGHAVLAAAGGSVRRVNGVALDYAKASVGRYANPYFVARGAARRGALVTSC